MAAPSPASTPGARGTKAAVPRRSAGTVATLVDVHPAGEVLGHRAARRGPRPARRRARPPSSAARRAAADRLIGAPRSAVPSRVVTRCPHHASTASGKSSRQCAPRVSSRRLAAATSAPATACSPVASQASGDGAVPVRSAERGERRARLGERARRCAAPRRRPIIAAPRSVAHARVEQGRAARRTGPARPAAAGRPRGRSPIRAANTRPSSRQLEASRLAPCTPVQATSPQAYRPGTVVRPARSVRTPPLA